MAFFGRNSKETSYFFDAPEFNLLNSIQNRPASAVTAIDLQAAQDAIANSDIRGIVSLRRTPDSITIVNAESDIPIIFNPGPWSEKFGGRVDLSSIRRRRSLRLLFSRK